MRKLILLFIILFTWVLWNNAFAEDWDGTNSWGSNLWSSTIKDWLWLSNDISVFKKNENNWVDQLSWLLKSWIDLIFWLLVVLLTWVFIFIWWKLAMSKWDAEEFKKWLIWFVYAVIWAALIPASYAIIQIITWIKL